MDMTQQLTSRAWPRTAGLLSALALTVGLAACDRADERTAGQKVDAAVEKTERAAATAREEASQAAKVVENRVDDMSITASVNAGLAKDPVLSAVKIDVDTKSGVVTLTGPAPTPDAKDRATTIAQNVKGVAGVNNNLQVGAAS
jgi:hyperosmotically inducible protein